MMNTLSPEIAAKVAAWSDAPFDEATRHEVQSLLAQQDYANLNDAFYQDLEFGTGGLRGTMGVGTNRMNRYTVGAATQGLANYLRASFPNQVLRVAVAHDSRLNSREFARVTAEVFAANDIEVFLFSELRPTPLLSFAIRHLGCQSGVVITASHNPKEYNGYKAYWNDGSQLVAPHDQGVINEVKRVQVENIRFEANPARIHALGAEVDEEYLRVLAAQSLSPEIIAAQSALSIVYTPIHGTGITLVPKALERFGFKNVHIVAEQATPDGNFPTVIYPNPEEAEALHIGLEKAKALNADLLLGTDPDTDRVGIAVKNLQGEWQLLNGNQTGALIVHYLLRRQQALGKLQTGNPFIAKTIVTSYLLDAIAAHYGVPCHNTLTGFKYIAELIRAQEGKARFIGGGEESYGYMIGDFVRDKDAVAASALIAELVAVARAEGKTAFEQLVDIYLEYGFYLEKLVSITKKGQSGQADIKAMMDRFRQHPPQTLAGSRVIKVMDYQHQVSTDLLTLQTTPITLAKSNVLQFYTEAGDVISARPSGTEPKIKFYFSVKTHLAKREAFRDTEAVLEAKIQAMIQDLGV